MQKSHARRGAQKDGRRAAVVKINARRHFANAGHKIVKRDVDVFLVVINAVVRLAIDDFEDDSCVLHLIAEPFEERHFRVRRSRVQNNAILQKQIKYDASQKMINRCELFHAQVYERNKRKVTEVRL